jgi:hypothetical protein
LFNPIEKTALTNAERRRRLHISNHPRPARNRRYCVGDRPLGEEGVFF